VREQFTGVIDERMPESFERGDVAPVALYRIGHTDDSNEFMFHDSWFLPGCFVFDLPSTATRKHARHRFALRFARRNGDLTRILPERRLHAQLDFGLTSLSPCTSDEAKRSLNPTEEHASALDRPC
jgi:hypothetical protein